MFLNKLYWNWNVPKIVHIQEHGFGVEDLININLCILPSTIPMSENEKGIREMLQYFISNSENKKKDVNKDSHI